MKSGLTMFTLTQLAHLLKSEYDVNNFLISGKWTVESGKWKVEVESGEWRVESGEWKIKSGKWRVESGYEEQKVVAKLQLSILHFPLSTLRSCHSDKVRRIVVRYCCIRAVNKIVAVKICCNIARDKVACVIVN
jgi:hypothetical protein